MKLVLVTLVRPPGTLPSETVRMDYMKVINLKYKYCTSVTARRTLPLPPGKISKSFVTLF